MFCGQFNKANKNRKPIWTKQKPHLHSIGVFSNRSSSTFTHKKIGGLKNVLLTSELDVKSVEDNEKNPSCVMYRDKIINEKRVLLKCIKLCVALK